MTKARLSRAMVVAILSGIYIFMLLPAVVGAQVYNRPLLPAITNGAGLDAVATAIGDFNDDGLNDLLMFMSDNTLRLHLQDQLGKLTKYVEYPCPSPNSNTAYSGALSAHDMNGDGRDDAVLGSANGTTIFYQNAGGTLDAGVTINSTNAEMLRIADINNDGLPDIVFINSSWDGTEVYILIKSGGGFSASGSYSLEVPVPYDIGVGDLNNDGYKDIAVTGIEDTLVTSNHLGLLYHDSSSPGTFQAPSYPGTPFIPYSCSIEDMNNDGLPDLVTGGDVVMVWYQDGGGNLTTPPTRHKTNFNFAYSAHTHGDINGDGLTDIIMSSNDLLIVVLQGAGGTLGPQQVYAHKKLYVGDPSSIAYGDLNNDGLKDISLPGNYIFYAWTGNDMVLIRTPNGISPFVDGFVTIDWKVIGPKTNTANIHYSIDGGTTWNAVATNVTNSGNYYWKIPFTPSDNCLVRVTQSNGIMWGETIVPFSILDDGVDRVVLTYPQGGESFAIGRQYEVLWDTTGSVKQVELEFSVDDGVTWQQIVAATDNDGSYTWQVPADPSLIGKRGVLRIKDAEDGSPADKNQTHFFIVDPTVQGLTLRAPNGGEVLTSGDSYPISWDSLGAISNVLLEYSAGTGSGWKYIDVVPNSGSYSWTVPGTPSSSCLVRISDAADSTPSDVSNGTFSIVNTTDIVLLTPNGGDLLWTGGSYEITWSTTSAVTGSIRIQYSTDGGVTWKTVDASTPNDGSYTWAVPNTPSNQCQIKISDNNALNLWDSSDATFTIARMGDYISVTSPVSGDYWQVGSSHEITWISGSGVSGNVKIQYSVNSQASWSTIVSSTPNDGSYTWTVPNVPSETCNIRIIDAADGSPSGTSSGHFIIGTGPGVPVFALNHARFYFASTISSSAQTDLQSIIVNNTGYGTLKWTASVYDAAPWDDDNLEWLRLNNSSGINTGQLDIYIKPGNRAPGTYAGAVQLISEGASNSPYQVDVVMTIYPAGTDALPFGTFETPIGGSVVRGSVPVTGWVLDDIGIDKVTIWRGNGGSKAYVGEAVLVEGARPDVASSYPTYPMSYKAGWGYMLLTNMLPNGGNGTYTLYAHARDEGGHEVVLGSKTIICDNANAVKPFGAIDTPTQGGGASGASYRNQGWVLTPMPNKIPVDGSTIKVYVDGIQVGGCKYNIYRSDIAGLFPGYANTDGALAYLDFDTRAFVSGLHTIQWTATDSAGNTAGIGSRYFTIKNAGYQSRGKAATTSAEKSIKVRKSWHGAEDLARIKSGPALPLEVRTGYDDDSTVVKTPMAPNGAYRVRVPQDGRVVVGLNRPQEKVIAGYMQVRGQLRPLPPGASLDTAGGKFYWQVGPAFLGTYDFVVISEKSDGTPFKTGFSVAVTPRFAD